MNFNELLLESGFSPLKAELWTTFLGEVLGLIDAAANELRETDTWEKFCKKRGALSKPKKRKRSKDTERTPIEDAITAELGHILRKLRARLPSDHFLRRQEVVFETEHLVEGENSTGRHSRKVDFFIYAQTGPNAPELAIEAKPLKTKGDVASRYLGEDGIGCFFSGDPVYTHETVAAMLAYSISETADPFREEIYSALTKYQPTPLALLQTVVHPIAYPIYCSRHSRSDLNLEPIAIVHLEHLYKPEVTPDL